MNFRPEPSLLIAFSGTELVRGGGGPKPQSNHQNEDLYNPLLPMMHLDLYFSLSQLKLN